jgi:hypothetical protein
MQNTNDDDVGGILGTCIEQFEWGEMRQQGFAATRNCKSLREYLPFKESLFATLGIGPIEARSQMHEYRACGE